ncbi:MAG TPA: DUF1918 domain-containing protein [Candidatus Limnocylindrales bacterium]|jgi:hypothetical protein
MKGRRGDTILIESERVGSPPRTGKIEEVLQQPWGVRYRVRWDDGRVSTIRPIAGAARVKRPAKGAMEWQVLS